MSLSLLKWNIFLLSYYFPLSFYLSLKCDFCIIIIIFSHSYLYSSISLFKSLFFSSLFPFFSLRFYPFLSLSLSLSPTLSLFPPLFLFSLSLFLSVFLSLCLSHPSISLSLFLSFQMIIIFAFSPQSTFS